MSEKQNALSDICECYVKGAIITRSTVNLDLVRIGNESLVLPNESGEGAIRTS
jgi:hypothetical protein